MGQHIDPWSIKVEIEDGRVSYAMEVPKGTAHLYRDAFERACADMDALILKGLAL